MKKCKWCNGTGREQPKKDEYSEMDVFGFKYGGFKNASKCKKCNGTGYRVKNGK